MAWVEDDTPGSVIPATGGKWVEDDAPQITPESAAVGMGQRMIRGVLGARQGTKDILDAGAGLIVNALPESVVNAAQELFGEDFAPNAQQFNQRQAQQEKEYTAQRSGLGGEGLDLPRLAGNVFGSAPAMAVLPGTAPTLLGTAARGIVTGGGIGALQPVTDDTRPFWEQKREQIGLGAITGGIGAPVMQTLGRIVAPKIDQGVKYLMDRGVRPRPDQIIGPTATKIADKAQSIPIVGDAIAGSQRRAVEDFNRAAYNEVLKPLGIKHTGNIGREGIGEVQTVLGQAYDDILPKIQFKGDGKFVSEFKGIAKLAQNLPPDKYKQFETVVKNEIIPRLSKTGQMDGLTYKQMESELSNFARNYSSSASPDDRALASAIKEIMSSARSSLERSNPKFAPQLKKINQAYATFTRVQDAAGRIGTQEGVFTPEQLLSAVRAGDRSARKGAFARGDALLQELAETGKKVLGNKYPDSGTAGRLANMGAGAAVFGAPGVAIPGALIGAAPYTEFGQQLATALLTKRPEWAGALRQIMERSAVPGASALPFGISTIPGSR